MGCGAIEGAGEKRCFINRLWARLENTPPPVTCGTEPSAGRRYLLVIGAGRTGPPGEKEEAAMLTVLTTVLFGIIAVSGVLGVSSLFVLSR